MSDDLIYDAEQDEDHLNDDGRKEEDGSGHCRSSFSAAADP